MEQQEYVSPSIELEPEDDKSAFDRFGEVFTSPGEAFRGLRTARKGPIIVWGLVIAALVATFSVVITMVDPELYEKGIEMRHEQLEKAREKGMDKEIYEQQVEALEEATPSSTAISSGIGAFFVTPILMAVFGLISLVILKVVARDNKEGLTYGVALSVVLISSMISFVAGIIQTIVKMLTDNIHFEFSPNAFVQPENFVVSFLLGLVNPFTLWWLFAAGKGTSVVTGAPLGKSVGLSIRCARTSVKPATQ